MKYKYRGDVGYIDLAITLIMSLVIGTTLMLGIKGIMTGPEGTNLSRQLYNELTTQVVNAPFQHGYDSDSLVKIYLDQDSITLLPKQQKQITYQLYPANAADQTVLWSIGNSNVATVSNSGLVTGVAEGDTVVYATTKTGVRASCKVHVDPLVYISFSQTSMQLRIGAVTDTGKINYTLSPANAKNKLVTWISSDSNVASVDVNGNVTPHNPGDTVITGTTYTGNYATCTVHVTRVWYLTLSAGAGGSVSPAGSNLYQEGTWITITASPFGQYQFLCWSDGNANVSRSFSMSGNVTLSATFALADGYQGAYVSINRTKANIYIGSHYKFQTTLTSGNTITSWTSSNPSVVSVDQTGTINALQLGSAMIYVNTAWGSQAACAVTVVNEVHFVYQRHVVAGNKYQNASTQQSDFDSGIVENDGGVWINSYQSTSVKKYKEGRKTYWDMEDKYWIESTFIMNMDALVSIETLNLNLGGSFNQFYGKACSSIDLVDSAAPAWPYYPVSMKIAHESGNNKDDTLHVLQQPYTPYNTNAVDIVKICACSRVQDGDDVRRTDTYYGRDDLTLSYANSYFMASGNHYISVPNQKITIFDPNGTIYDSN